MFFNLVEFSVCFFLDLVSRFHGFVVCFLRWCDIQSIYFRGRAVLRESAVIFVSVDILGCSGYSS